MQWATIAPLENLLELPDGIELPYKFADGVFLKELPKWTKQEKILRFLGISQRNLLQKYVRFCISVEYEADALGTPDSKWSGEEPRAIQDTALETTRDVNMSLWLARPTGLNFGMVFHGEGSEGDWRFRQLIEVEPFRALPDYDDKKNIQNPISL